MLEDADDLYAGDSALSGETSNGTQNAYSASDAEKRARAWIATVQTAFKEKKIGEQTRRELYVAELANIESAHDPKLFVAVLGATGTGKSSLINAILGEHIVPTSGMTACTAAVTEISYNSQDLYELEVEFLALEEWQKELNILFRDIRDNDEGAEVSRSHVRSRNDPLAIAKAKIRAAYPETPIDTLLELDVDTILARFPRVTELLGSIKHEQAATPCELETLLSQYVESQEQHSKDKLAYWALIRKIKIKCPSSILATGLILVDLPGVADSNAARAQIARDYIQKCDHFWVIAPITRAVNDKTAQELLGKAFRQQMKLDGHLNPKSFTFIATKCDDVSPREAVRDLALSADLQYNHLQASIDDFREDIKKWKGLEKSAIAAHRDMEKCLKDARNELVRYQKQLAEHKLSSAELKRKICKVEDTTPGPAILKRSRLNDAPAVSVKIQAVQETCKPGSQEAEPPKSCVDRYEMSLETYIADICKKIAAYDQSLASLVKQKEDARSCTNELDSQLKLAIKELHTFCSLKRSEYSKRRIQSDFEAGLAELGIVTTEALPVFTVSSRDFMALSSGDDHDASCFTELAETGIPALRKWCLELTLPVHEAATSILLERLQASVQSCLSFAEGAEGVSNEDRKALKKEWESPADSLSDNTFKDRSSREQRAKHCKRGLTWDFIREFEDIAKNCVCDLQDVFAEYLGDKCETGADLAAESAVAIADGFADSMKWQTYKATLRREGSWNRGDLNEELVIPFSGHIASSWCDLFERDFFASLESDIFSIVESTLDDIRQSVPDYIVSRAEKQVPLCKQKARATLKALVPAINQTLQSERKSINRCLAPHIQSQLLDAYAAANEEQEFGSMKRKKKIIHDFVEANKDTVFNDLYDLLAVGLNEAVVNIEGKIHDHLANMAKTIEMDITVLWAGPVSGEEQIQARLEVMQLLNRVSGEIERCIEARKLRDQQQA